MTERDAFLAKILAEPDEDTHRLVFADWLEEYGHEPARAEFIRQQVATYQQAGTFWDLRGRTGKPTRFKDLCRIEPWVYANAAEHVRNGTGYLQASASSSAVFWRRGFIEAVYCSGVNLGPVLDELKRHPIREVVLTNEPFAGLMERLHPGWKHGNLFQFRDERNALAMKLLSGSGGFPSLLHAWFDRGPLGTTTCPFRPIAKPKAASE